MNRKAQLAVILVVSSLWLGGCNKQSQPKSEESPSATPSTQTAPPSNAASPSAEQSGAQPATPALPAPAAAPAEPPPPPPPTIVPKGTVISASISAGLSSKTSHTGDEFEATVVSPVKVKGTVLVPAGSIIHGVVTEAKSAGKFKGEADLLVSARSISIRGRSYPIQVATLGSTTKGKGKRTAAMVGGGAGGGALIGGIAGGGKGALIGGLVGAGAGTAGAAMTGNNRDITMPAETVLGFHLSAPLRLGTSEATAAQ